LPDLKFGRALCFGRRSRPGKRMRHCEVQRFLRKKEKRTPRSQPVGSCNGCKPAAVLETASARRWQQRRAKPAVSWQQLMAPGPQETAASVKGQDVRQVNRGGFHPVCEHGKVLTTRLSAGMGSPVKAGGLRRLMRRHCQRNFRVARTPQQAASGHVANGVERRVPVASPGEVLVEKRV
jgi:hypothetical protein